MFTQASGRKPVPQLLCRTQYAGSHKKPPHSSSYGKHLTRLLWGTPHPVPCGGPLTQASVGNPSPRPLCGHPSTLPLWGDPHPELCGEPLTQSPVGRPSPRPLWGALHPGSWVGAHTYAPGRSPVNSLAHTLPLGGVISLVCVGILSRVNRHSFTSPRKSMWLGLYVIRDSQ